ncbi:unnamed protein product [Acanthosepion pharaonis]|uniref:Uncharacterized protein n=1 Tax=Acanthosepion pharaonis TaxID=158019 RepID=A0A812BNS8_ACAPH|nr:unnamed protein product [Sepia pharaonis]
MLIKEAQFPDVGTIKKAVTRKLRKISVRYEGKKDARVPGADYNATHAGLAVNPGTLLQQRPLGLLRHRSVRNARNAATTARSREAETFDRRRTRQSREAAAAARSRESETELQQGTRNARNAAATSVGPRAQRQGQTDFQGLLQIWPLSSFWSFLAFNYDPGINLTTRDDKWAGEPAGLCCSSGKVRVPPLHEPPTPLRGLIAGSHPDSNHFLKTNYNVQAETRIGISPLSGRVPRRDVILLLQAMLHEVISYIRSFKYALENAPFPSFSIVIDADKRPHDEHERRYNAPACNEVVANYTWGARPHLRYCPQIKRRRSSQDFRDPLII